MNNELTQYSLSSDDAAVLASVVCLPAAERETVLGSYVSSYGVDALVRLFSQLVGAANSVVANNHEMAELLLITEGNLFPETAAKINLPTLLGAMQGVRLASAVNAEGSCEGCAYRCGTAANQSVTATDDAQWCADDGRPFFCHERALTADGKATKRCVGDALHQGSRATEEP